MGKGSSFEERSVTALTAICPEYNGYEDALNHSLFLKAPFGKPWDGAGGRVLTSEQLSAAAHPYLISVVVFGGFVAACNLLGITFSLSRCERLSRNVVFNQDRTTSE